MAIEVKENSRLAFEIGAKKSNLIKTLIGENNSDSSESAELSSPKNKIVSVSLDLIDPLTSFEHPFEKSINRGIEELAESIKIHDVLLPIIIRPRQGGRFETLAGHRRTLGSRLAEKTKIDAIIKDCDDNTAKLIVTETNINQREEILPSERAKAYKLQMEALKNQGKRNDLLKAVQEEINLWSTGPQVKSRDIVAELNHTSAKEVSRYLRLNYLIKPLIDMVDDKQISIRAAVELSYLKDKDQASLAKLLESNSDLKITTALAEELRAASKEMELSSTIIEATIDPPPEEKIKNFISKPSKPAYKTAFKAVEKYIKKLDVNEAEKLAQADEKELERRIKETIETYLRSL